MAGVVANVIADKSLYIHPLGNRVLIEPILTAKEIKGIIIPTAVKDGKDYAPTEGTVIELGPECELISTDTGEQTRLQPGDRVVFSKYAGVRLDFTDGGAFLLMPEQDIAGVLDPKCPAVGKGNTPEFVPK